MESTKTCTGCNYFFACGDAERTEPCDGREIASEKKLTEERASLMLEIEKLTSEWLDCIEYGNEDAYTDNIIELLKNHINNL